MLTPPDPHSVPLLLLAAGRSTRFGALKQIASVGPSGASILAYTVVDALLAGFVELVLVIRPEIEALLREHLDQHLGAGLPIRFVHQREALGTGHATLVGLAGIDGPAAVANGDDAYGRDALRQLRQSASFGTGSHGLARCTLVAYPIASTLSEYGGVSRGWVQTDGDRVVSIDEILGVRASSSGALSGQTADGESCSLPADALGSMNLWMLGPGVRACLERAFDAYSGDTEFYLSTALDDLRQSGELAIHVAGRANGWFGLTFPPDAPAVRDRLATAHAVRHYIGPLSTMVEPFRRSS